MGSEGSRTVAPTSTVNDGVSESSVLIVSIADAPLGDSMLLAGGELAEVSGFSYRARSLLCKHKIGRQTAPCEDAGARARHRVDFRATDAAGSAAVTCPRAAVARAKMSRSCCRIRASGWTSRCLFRMVFKYSPFG